MPRIGVVARADLTGLGNQSRNWVRLLNPDKLIIINSEPFNHNEQHYEWYNDYITSGSTYLVNGFINNQDMPHILNGIDVLLTFEIPYNYELFRLARARGVKTILQNNWEFTDYLQRPSLPLPDLLVNHSYWHLDDQRARWPAITEYCPTPIFIDDYDEIMLQNMDRDATKRRFVHIAGRKTYEDRNGTIQVLDAVTSMQGDFELVIKTQTTDISCSDPRVVIDNSQPVDEKELYRDFDAMIMPRRYAGACLPMTEALASGLPVIMTDIDPNNKVLPKEWLVPAKLSSQFMARTMIDVYTADVDALSKKIHEFVSIDWDELQSRKILAREIVVREYSNDTVIGKWALLMAKLGL